ncbi:hypothetical protein ES319_A12G059900v1 [Gossypium barbadense]|uniref:Uncharacterized protein n=2 Tax=Gossypium TaxID=3633 RepID=A0A5J5TCH1_GOSBA|nr:hypothetical protein ES319_A12G059900v1 [Gossypium barbadense]
MLETGGTSLKSPKLLTKPMSSSTSLIPRDSLRRSSSTSIAVDRGNPFCR